MREKRRSPYILRALSAYIEQEKLLSATSRPLLAVSGGRDSMALLSLFLHLYKWPISVAHFNFLLRGEESQRDQRHVEQICKSANLPLHIQCADAKKWSKEHKCSLEEGCRALRYEYFNALCDKYGYTEIVTAHHAEDQAETLLFHLSRGCGVEGLRGMRPRNGKIVRPLLSFNREELESWLSENQIAYVDDSSNASDDYARNYIRHNVLPDLVTVNQQAVRHIYALSRYADQVYETLRTESGTLFGSIERPIPFVFDISASKIREHYGLALFWFRERLQYLNFSNHSVDTLQTLLSRGQTGKKVLAPNWEAYLERGKIVIVPRCNLPVARIYPDSETSDANFIFKQEVIKQQLSLTELKSYANRGKSTALFDFEQVRFPLTYRVWEKGDFIYPLGMPNGRKKVSDVLTDAHYPTQLRQQVCVLVDATGSILWIPPLRQSSVAALSPSTRQILVVEYHRSENSF